MPHPVPFRKDLPGEVALRSLDHNLPSVRSVSSSTLREGKEGVESVSRTKKDIMREAAELRPTIHVGKDGITDELVEEVKQQLKKRKVVKVRLLDSSGEVPKETAELVADRSNAILVDVRGSVAVMCEKRYFGVKTISDENR